MSQSKKIFTRMCLNNWGGINHKVLQFNEYVNLFSGKSGSGKSTVMDAIQVILYGSFSPSFLNKAADDAKNRRSVLSYLRGEQKDGSANRGNCDFCSVIALEIADTGTHITTCVGIAFEVRKNDSEIKKFSYFSHSGKMPEPETLFQYICKSIACKKDMTGMKVLVTAGPTQEALDPVRYITNHSSGKMGYALAKAAMLRGADVTLVSGPCAIEPPPFVKLVPVVTAKEMFDAVTSVSFEQDIIIKAAAVADYRPANVYEDKVKKHEEQMSIKLEKTDDILGYLGEHRLPGQFLCGFSMETQNMIGNSRAKLGKKHLDMVAANNLKVAGAGFQGDTNVLTLITQDEDVSLQLMSKEDAALKILDKILLLTTKAEA